MHNSDTTKLAHKWHFAKDVQRDLLGDNKYDSSYFTGELKELGEELKKRDWPAIKDEAGDVAYSAQMIAHQKSGINFPMIGADGSIKKFMDRRAIWKQIFKEHGGEFHTDYLKGGSNYARPEKIQKALGMAGIKIDDDAAAAVSRRHTEKQAEITANAPDMLIKYIQDVKNRKYLYHGSGQKLDNLDPKFNSKKHYGYEYGVPVVFATDKPSSAFTATPTPEYLALKNKINDSIYHRLIDPATGRKLLLGHNPTGYMHVLPASSFKYITREDKELGQYITSNEYVSEQPVKPLRSYKMRKRDVDAIPEYEFLGEDNVGEMNVQDYLTKAKDPKVILAIQNWLNKRASINMHKQSNIMNKEAYGIADYDERSNKTYVYERSPLDNPLWFSRGDHKNNIKLLKWMEGNKNPKVKYTLNKNKYTDDGELSIADLLKLHGNNPEELSNYIFDHTESSGNKFHSPFDWKKLNKHMNKEAILRGFYKRAEEVKLAAFPDNTLAGVGLMGAAGLILSPLVAAINLAANKVAPTDEEEKNRTYINQLKRDLWRAPLLGASIGAVRGGLEDYRSYNVNKEAMLGEFYKRAGEILNKSLIDAVAAVKPENSEAVLKRLAQIKEPFMTPTIPQVVSPFESRAALIAKSPQWENNAQPQFAADMTKLQAKPVTGIAEILDGLLNPKTLNKEWTNIAVRQPINVGFSNAVMRALSPTPVAVASQK